MYIHVHILKLRNTQFLREGLYGPFEAYIGLARIHPLGAIWIKHADIEEIPEQMSISLRKKILPNFA